MKVVAVSKVKQSFASPLSELPGSSPVGYELTVGSEYTVLGISVFVSADIASTVFQVLLKDDFGRCAFVPLSLLKISSPQASRYWVARVIDNQGLTLWPAEFYADYFHDDLSEGNPEQVAMFNRVVAQLESE